MLQHSLPILVRCIAVEAFNSIQLNRPIRVDLCLSLHSTHLLKVTAVLAALAPNDVCMQFVILDEEEELAAVSLVLVIMVDCSSISIKDSDIFSMK